MKMRWLTGAVFLALMISAGREAPSAKGNTAGEGPVIEIKNTSHDFGAVFKNEKFVHAFIVRNAGTADLVIEEVKPG